MRHFGAKGTLQVSLAQPLRVEGGSAVLSVPVGRTRDREVVRRKFSADLSPSGRQLDLSVRWDRPLAGGLLRLGGRPQPTTPVTTPKPGHGSPC